jgi:hypothetical protein
MASIFTDVAASMARETTDKKIAPTGLAGTVLENSCKLLSGLQLLLRGFFRVNKPA